MYVHVKSNSVDQVSMLKALTVSDRISLEDVKADLDASFEH